MRRLALPVLLFSFAASVLGADYRLSVDAPGAALTHAKAVRVFGLQLAKGDRIVAISPGKVEGIPVRIVLDSKAGAGSLLGEIKNEGFSGKLIRAKGPEPARTLNASLSLFEPVSEPGLLDAVAGFFTSTAGFITIGSLVILGAVFFLLKSRSSGEGGAALPNRRKAIDESLKDIQRRLEKVDENQHQLVKKPPMLRSFRRQIEEFDARLGAIEGALKTALAMNAETGKLVQGIAQAQRDAQAKADATDGAVKLISANLDATRQQVGDLSSALDQIKKDGHAKSESLDAKLANQGAEIQNRLSSLEKGQEGANSSLAALSEQGKSLKESLASRESVDALQAQVHELANKEIDFAPIRADLAELPTKDEIEPIQTELQELQGFVGWLRDEQRGLTQQLSELTNQKIDLSPVQEKLGALESQIAANDLSSELKTLQAQVDALPKTAADLSPVKKGLVDLGQRLESLASKEVDLTGLQSSLAEVSEAVAGLQQREIDLAPVLAQLEELKPANYEAEFKNLKSANEALANGLSELQAAFTEPNKEWAGVSADQKALAAELAKLQEAVAEIAIRTDQRESILLSLQSRASESESGAAAGAEILPVVADLRLELQSLAADQSKTASAIESLSTAISELRSDAQSIQPPDAFDSSALEAEVRSLAEALANLKLEPAMVPVEAANVDLSGIESKLNALSESVAHLQSAGPAEAVAFDASGLEAELRSLAASFEEFQSRPVPEAAPVDFSKIEGELQSLSRSFERWQSEHPDLSHELASLKGALDKHQSESHEHRERLAAEIVELKHAEPERDHKHHSLVIEEMTSDEVAQSLESLPEPEAAKPMLVVEEFVSESSIESDGDAESGPEGSNDQDDWRLPGGSRARRWSTQIDAPVAIQASNKNLSPLTPTITPDTEFPIGPVLYTGKRILYSHGNALRSMWPGRGPNSASLQEPVPADPWRLAFLDGHVFCVEDGQVEIVSLASWHVISRFSGDFIDQTATETHWVGLGSALGKLYLDYRNLQGRLLGEPVQLPIDANNGRGLVADKERVYVGSRDGQIFKVEHGKVVEIASAKSEGLKLHSLTATKPGILAIFRGEGKDHVRLFSFDGKPLKQLVLDFQHATANPVVMGDRLYLLDSGNQKAVAISLRKLEILGTTDLPGSYLLTFSGFFHGDHHNLLLTIGNDQTTAKISMLDLKTGAIATVCDTTHKQVESLVADGRLVVASSTAYQNSLRVFDPFGFEQARKAA